MVVVVCLASILVLASCVFDTGEKQVCNDLSLWNMENRLFYLVDRKQPEVVGGVLEGRVHYICLIDEVVIVGFTRMYHGADLEWAAIDVETKRIDSLGLDDADRIWRDYKVSVDTVSAVLDFWKRL